MSTRKALAMSFLDRYSGLVIHTASSMVIARLLIPSEIGVYSVTMVLLGFVATFRDLGAGQYLVQSKELSAEEMRATWSVQLGLGCFLALLVLAAAIPVADFYREPQMTAIMIVLAVNFAITPFLAYPNAWLVRELRFGPIAAVRFTGALVHASAAIGLAWIGFGAVSLAWANVLTTVASILAIWLIAWPKLPWRPTLEGIGNVVTFGGKLTIASLMNNLSSGTPELILGKLQTMAEAGLFSRCQGLVVMFQRLVMDAVGTVALPYFSKQSRESADIAPAFVVAMELVCGLGWSFFFGIALLAYPAIQILYGPQWDAAVDPARWLSIAFAINLPCAICYPPLIAVGAVGDVLKAAFISTVATIAASAVGASLGLVALSQALILSACISASVWITIAKKHIRFSTTALIHCWLKSLFVAAGAAVIPLITVLHWGARSPLVFQTTLLSGIGGLFGAVCCAWLIKHQLWVEAVRIVRRSKH